MLTRTISNTTTLLSGKAFTTLGIVVDEGFLGMGGHKLRDVFSEIDRQAKSLGADAVIDVKVTRTGENSFIIMGQPSN